MFAERLAVIAREFGRNHLVPTAASCIASPEGRLFHHMLAVSVGHELCERLVGRVVLMHGNCGNGTLGGTMLLSTLVRLYEIQEVRNTFFRLHVRQPVHRHPASIDRAIRREHPDLLDLPLRRAKKNIELLRRLELAILNLTLEARVLVLQGASAAAGPSIDVMGIKAAHAVVAGNHRLGIGDPRRASFRTNLLLDRDSAPLFQLGVRELWLLRE